MDNEKTGVPPLEYSYQLYGYHLVAPVFEDTGPLISFTDPPHAKKTARNQPQYGTHTASLGSGHLVNRNLVELSNLPSSGLVFRDVHNVDKQDDGAARRLFHTHALEAMVDIVDGNKAIRPGFEGLFIYLYVLGCLFEAWMSPDMEISERILAATRARFWLHYCHRHVASLVQAFPDLYSSTRSFISPSSFQILNRLCDTLVLLALAFTKYYPGIPFCPRYFNTEFVEHFFGIARQLLPNFSYAELLKMIQHVMVRQRILESDILKTRRERKSASGYIYDAHTDMRKESTTAAPPPANLSKHELDHLVKLGHDEAAQICRDLLHIPIPRFSIDKPVALCPLGASRKTAAANRKESKVQEGDYASDIESSSDDSDEEDTGVAIPLGEATARASEAVAAFEKLSSTLDDENKDAVLELAAIGHTDMGLPLNTGADLLLQGTPTCLEPLLAVEPTLFKSRILDVVEAIDTVESSCHVSVAKIVKSRALLQSGTTTKSERVVDISKKYTLENQRSEAVSNEESQETPKFTPQEAAHRLRIVQELNPELKKEVEKKTRQLRWQTFIKELETTSKADSEKMLTGKKTRTLKGNGKATLLALPHLAQKNVTALNPIRVNRTYLIMRSSSERLYIGHVLDIYKKGENSRYGSITEASNVKDISWLSLRVYLSIPNTYGPQIDDDDDMMDEPDPLALEFSCRYKTYKSHLHTHAPADHIIYNLGESALTFMDGGILRAQLSKLATTHWININHPETTAVLTQLPPLKIRIPGGKMAKGKGLTNSQSTVI